MCRPVSEEEEEGGGYKDPRGERGGEEVGHVSLVWRERELVKDKDGVVAYDERSSPVLCCPISIA